MGQINQECLDQILLKARTHKAWLDKPVSDEIIHQIYDLMKWGPTSANCCPARLVFVKSSAAKENLIPCLDKGNVDKVRSAPCTVIVAHDMRFYEKFKKLAPHAPNMASVFEGKKQLIDSTAFRNGSLEGAYFMIAARALGLDCGPMSGFDNAKVDEVFLTGTTWKSNFICNIGYGDASKLFPRAPRLDFDEACRIV
jgi:nitroreductase